MRVKTNTKTLTNSPVAETTPLSEEVPIPKGITTPKKVANSRKIPDDKESSTSESKRPIRKVKRSQIHLWIPNQHGAWAMVLCPPFSGLLAGGFSWTGLWLCIVWLVCYLASYTVGRWLISRRAKRFSRPAATYSVIVLVLGVPLVILQPHLLWWSPVYLVVLAAHLWASHSRSQRSLWANGSAVIGSGLTALLTASLGTASANPLPAVGIVVAIAYVLQEFGVVLFVKTMFRERDSKLYLTISLLWHVGLCGLGFWTSWPTGVAALFLLTRAAILPAYAKRLTPLQIGLCEIVVSLTSFIGITWGSTLSTFI